MGHSPLTQDEQQRQKTTKKGQQKSPRQQKHRPPLQELMEVMTQRSQYEKSCDNPESKEETDCLKTLSHQGKLDHYFRNTKFHKAHQKWPSGLLTIWECLWQDTRK